MRSVAISFVVTVAAWLLAAPAALASNPATPLSVAVPIPRGVICDSIAPGVIRITFSRAAGLGNPKSPGAYIVTVRRGAETFSAPFRIH